MKAALILVLLTVPAFAQQADPQAQAFSQEIMSQLNAKLQCSVALIAAQARVKELEDKYEPKKGPEKK